MSADAAETTTITFPAIAELLGDRPILRLPQDASDRLPSRGQVAVDGSIDGTDFTTVVEPDGRRGHWISIEPDLWQRLGTSPGEAVEVSLNPRKEWPEVTVPEDLQAALDAAVDLDEVWTSLTPMARWEWVRWIRATKSADTRARRVDVAISKLESGKRRPCCFDLSSCTDPELSKSGKLLGLS
ncbi:YdeI/OmpD-associated family protein [Brevibacterium renqingii]|uniref:YdeI/OmpD-associated family protein n=1 Tax=Brevibacterium renqingii TaxID=2776916 RepID=UPI001ADF1F2F|nr:YdeI/OmpD-associated family protein [Brevibacterium renqingii]